MALRDVSSKGTRLIYSNRLLSIPHILQVPGIDNWFRVNELKTAEMQTACDGTQVAHVVASHVEGTITLNPFSPGYKLLSDVADLQNNVDFVIPGTLVVVSIQPGLYEITLNDFVLTTSFAGFSFDKKIDDVTVGFACNVPSYIIKGEIIEAGINFADALASL